MTTTNYFQKTTIFLFALFAFAQSDAQLSYGGEPYKWLENRFDESIPVITTEELDLDLIEAQDAINDREPGIPFRFGIEHDVNNDFLQHGRWVLDDITGNEIWQIAIHCPSAMSINLTFNLFDLPKGGKLYIWSADREQFIGSFDFHNNEESGILATSILHTDKVVVEYQVPSSQKSETKLSIGQIVHGYRSVLKNQYTEHNKGNRDPFGSSGNCHNNVICPVAADWQVEKRSVVLIQLGGSICSGVLVNNTANNGTPYILTAHHCTPNNNNVSNWIFYFNHDSPTCNGSTGPTNQSISGATFRAKRSVSDFALVQMSSVPLTTWNPYYAGWDRTDNSNVSNSVGIHHPAGDVKKISFDNNAPYQENAQGAQVWVIENWEDGVTEGGSSGSPLFNPQHRIIGQLYAGSSECIGSQENNGYDIYGRFGVSWNSGNSSASRLREWLDPGNTGATTLDGFPNSNVVMQLDASASSLLQIPPVVCGTEINPILVLENNGLQTLTSCSISYQLNNGATQTYNWTGSLAQNQTTQVTLPTLAISQANNTFTITVSNPNNSTDQNVFNNSITVTFNAVFEESQMVSFTLNLDNAPQETSWVLRNSFFQTVYSSNGPYATGQAGETISMDFCLALGCYTFTIYDSAANGICCGNGNGAYTLIDETGTVIVEDNSFDSYRSTTFCLTATLVSEENRTGVSLFPNPSSNLVTIRHKTKIENVILRDMMGKIVYTINPNSTTVEISTAQMSNGIYTCEVVTSFGTAVEKLIVKH